MKEHNQNWSKKINALLNLISFQVDIDKCYFYVKDLYEAKKIWIIN